MTLPKAVTSSVKTPGFYLRINLLASAANPGSSVLRGLLIAHKRSTGTIVEGTEVRQCFGPDEVRTALGEGIIGHLAAIQMFLAFPGLSLDVVAPAAPAGDAAEQTFTISGTTTDTNQFLFDVAGREIGPVAWAAGEAISVMRARMIAAFNAVRPLPGIAQNGIAADAVDFVAHSGGTWGNDVTIGVKKLSGSGGAIAVGGANLAGGTTELDITTVLSLVSTTEYPAIGLATSNADATLNTTASNVERLQNHIETNKSGLDSLLQYGFVGHTGSIANAKNGAIGRNAVDLTQAFAQSAQSLPAELMGWEFGDALRWYSQRPTYNRIGNRAPYLFGAKDKVGDKLTPTEKEDLLNNGVTPYDFAPRSTELALVAPITTYSFDPSGAPDYRAYYQTDVWGQNAVARDLRVAIPQEFPNCSITEDLPAGTDDLPPGVVERRDVHHFTISRMRAWGTKLGVVNPVALDAAIEDGTLAVEIDETDKSQVNIFIPDKIIKPLAKFSAVFHKTG